MLSPHPREGSFHFSLGGELASFLPAHFSHAESLLFLGPLKSAQPDPCCGNSCYWLYEYDSETACEGHPCESVHRADVVLCSDTRGHCGTYDASYKTCTVNGGDYRYIHRCLFVVVNACGSETTPTPTPSPSPTPTPSPSPTPTPCPEGSFDPDPDGNCPVNANRVNGCCLCQQRNTDCARFGQGTFPGTDKPYCAWVERLCDCYNVDGPCADNPRPLATPIPTPTPSGGGGEQPPPEPCTAYWWVLYESYDGGQPWQEIDRWYAGCW